MSFKISEFTPYKHKKAKSIEINIKNNENQTIDFFKLQKGNTRDIQRVVNTLKTKYDFDLNPDEKKFLKKEISW